jgi:hypothetical protein
MRKLIAAMTVLLLTGCAQIPTQIDVKSGPEIASEIEQEFAYYSPSGPIAGADQQQIVSGFLAAGTGPQGDYSVAREFLSKDFAQRWKPDAAVLIRSGVPDFREVGTGVQIVRLTVTARLDEHGRYQDSLSSEPTSLRFQLQQEDGEWRISSAPDLTVVTSPVFSVVFQPYSVYFFDSQQRRLVSDSRWFPSRASTGTRLVNAMLAGPSSWMEDSIRTAIPLGTKLTIDAVKVENGVAQVDLDSTALSADAIGRRLMLAQIRATLLQLSGVNEVAIYVNASPQEIIPASVTPSPSGAQGIAMTEGVVRLGAGVQQPLPGTALFVANNQPSQFATNAATDQVAFATSTGVFLVGGSGISARAVQISEESDVAALAFDPDGLLWVFPRASGSELQIFDNTTLVKSLVLPALGERTAAEFSPDGARLGVLVQSDGQASLEIFTLTKDVRLMPNMLYRGVTIDNVMGVPISFAWQNQASVRVLELTPIGSTTLSDYPLAGPRSQLSMPPIKGRKIVGGITEFASYMLGENQEIWALAGGSWRRVLTSALDITNSR